MRLIKGYHHFRKKEIDPKDYMAKCERYIVDLLLTSKLPDSERDSSICWELKHQASTLQFARILALKRGLPVDICAVGLLFHDINSVIYGKYQDHAHLGTPIVMKILRKLDGFSDEEMDQIARIIYNHSDKHVWTKDPFQEIGKDIDVLDCFLYKGAFDYYLGNKPLPILKDYLKRAKNVWKELGLPPDSRFNLLDDYGPSWFQHIQTLHSNLTRDILAILLELSNFREDIGICLPPFCIVMEDKSSTFYANQQSWTNYIRGLASQTKGSIPNEKSKVFYSIIDKTLQKKSNYKTIDQIHSLVNEGIISDENFQEATNILFGSQNSSNNVQEHASLFWPLIDIYELLSGKKMIKRLEELGVELPLTIKEK